MFSTRLALAALAATSLVAPAANADDTEWAGFTCGFASTNDPSGLVEQDPNVQTGEMDCGPWTSFDVTNGAGTGLSPHPGPANVVITGTIQVNQRFYGGPAAAHATCAASGSGVAYGACVITYTALPTDNVYLCTHVTMKHNGITETYTYDADDDPATGLECGLAF